MSHAEFYRSLPAAIAHREHRIRDDAIEVGLDPGRVRIELGPERARAIASLRIPYTEVSFEFHDLSDAQREAFMTRFELYFRRGGG